MYKRQKVYCGFNKPGYWIFWYDCLGNFFKAKGKYMFTMNPGVIEGISSEHKERLTNAKYKISI